jgi:hypothetical protein
MPSPLKAVCPVTPSGLLTRDERRHSSSSVAAVSIRYGRSLRPRLTCSSHRRGAAT